MAADITLLSIFGKPAVELLVGENKEKIIILSAKFYTISHFT